MVSYLPNDERTRDHGNFAAVRQQPRAPCGQQTYIMSVIFPNIIVCHYPVGAGAVDKGVFDIEYEVRLTSIVCI